MELMLRSLFARHPADLPLALTVFDNTSTDDMTGVRAFAAERGVALLTSGFNTTGGNNSHGEILRRYVLDNPACTHYLFLDADVMFLEENTLGRMVDELEQ